MNHLSSKTSAAMSSVAAPPAGSARCPGPTAQQILASDRVPPPRIFTEESYKFLGDVDISPERYTSPDFFDQEMKMMWRRTWQWACRLEHIPEVGDYYIYDIGNISIIVARVGENDIKAYYNVCRHRGTKLRSHDGVGHTKDFRCPFHGWSWNLDGSLKNIPCAWDFPHVRREAFGLSEIKVGVWGGFVFINMDPNAPPLLDYIHPLEEHFGIWDLSKRHVFMHVEKELPANWKAAAEAFMEGYHIMATHPQLLTTFGDANTQYDIYGDHVSRFIELAGVSSPHIEPIPPEEMLKSMFVGGTSVLGADFKLREGDTARSVMANLVRKTLGEQFGLDLDTCSDTELIDPNQYTLFPNMFLFPGIGFPMIYRIRPVGMSPDRCRFELVFLRPNSPSGEIPEAPEPYKVSETESLASIPGFEPSLAMAMEQDLNNLRAQQEGYKFVDKGLTLGNYQEVRIRHLHQTLDLYLSGQK